MADTYTAHYDFTKPGIGSDADSWGVLLNTNFDSIDSAIYDAAQAASAAQSAANAAGGTARDCRARTR